LNRTQRDTGHLAQRFTRIARRTLWRLAVAVVAASAVIGSAALTAAFRSDMAGAQERIRGQSTTIASPYGAIEYSESGSGPPVLIVHGAGGGFDQGELIVRAVLNEGFRAISPSRFGYLASTAPDCAMPDDQAHAYATLLDHMEIERVAVVAMSAGGASALLFAALHPERVSSLTLLSTGVTALTTEDQSQANEKGLMWVRLFKFDFPYWFASKVFRKQVMGLMGAGDEVIAALSIAQRELVAQVIDHMNPASLRYRGVLLDNTNPLPGDRISSIRAPTLIVHAEDDTLQLYDNAVFAAATIPTSELLSYPRGGHFIMIVEQAAVGERVREHILANLSETAVSVLDAPLARPDPAKVGWGNHTTHRR
jgi:2-hydroxy-6-oxonona-2,4-dienedioate hydrolase